MFRRWLVRSPEDSDFKVSLKENDSDSIHSIIFLNLIFHVFKVIQFWKKESDYIDLINEGLLYFTHFSAQTLGGSGVFLLELTLSVRVTAGGVYES